MTDGAKVIAWSGVVMAIYAKMLTDAMSLISEILMMLTENDALKSFERKIYFET